MKKIGFILIALLLVVCNSANESSESNISTTTTTTPIVDEVTTTSIDASENNNEIIESYVYDSEKMSPFTGLELSPEIWLKRPRRVVAFKIDNNLNARPQSGLQEADAVMEILVEGVCVYLFVFDWDLVDLGTFGPNIS